MNIRRIIREEIDNTDVVITHDIWKRYKKMVMDKINDHNLNENDDMEWIKNIPDTQLISSLLIYYSIDQLNLLTDVEKLLWDYRNKRMKFINPDPPFVGPVGTYNENKIKRWNDILKRENCIGVLQVIYNGKELHMIPIYNLEDYKERVNEFSKVLKNNNYIGIIKPEDLLHDSSNINESNDFDWIKNEGKERIYIIEKLKKWVKKNNMDADFDLEYDKGYNNEKEVEEYFGKIWFSSDEHYFIELYETKDGFKSRLYELSNVQYGAGSYENEYLHNWDKSINEPIKSAEDFWRQVAFLIMTYGETTSWNSSKLRSAISIKESNDFDWAENQIEVGKCFRKQTLTSVERGIKPYTVKIIDIKQGEQLKGVGGRKLMDIPKGSFNERAIIIKFIRMDDDVYRGSWRDDIEIYYPEVQNWIDWGWLIPIECE